MTRTRKLAATIGTLLVAAALTACSDDPQPYAATDCDTSDLAEYDTDCGYWDGDGNFTTWYWVTSSGGYRPAGWHPLYPYGMSRPSNAKLTPPRHQATPPGVSVYKQPTRSGSKSTSGRSSSGRSSTSSVRGGRR